LTDLFSFGTRLALNSLIAATLERWPEHARFLKKSMANRPDAVLDTADRLAAIVLQLAEAEPGDLDTAIADYRFVCDEIVLPEEIFFRREGHYRLNSFVEANEQVYKNAPLMRRYMNGLLVTNVLWHNHCHAMNDFVADYLPRLKPGARHLEIGPGHGIFLYFAALRPEISSLTGWDLSPTSIAKTRHALDTLGIDRPVELVEQDMFAVGEPGADRLFDSIVMSELLEHVEDPVMALRSAARSLRPGGLIWINVPANSPAPDHIFLVNSPAHAEALVREAGLDIVASKGFAMMGVSLEKAARNQLSVNCVITARKP
jgi:2-polyprenyl-3-methyl-5-hydroxy-6-metoxy-1,4-benzoquinol methylase